MNTSDIRPSLLHRCAAMALGWGSVGAVYGLSAQRPIEQAYHLQPGPIELWFDFNPAGIWLYLSFFLLVPLGYLACAPARLGWLMRAMVLCALGAGVVFAVFPTTMTFPPVTQAGVSADMLLLLIRFDTLVNCLPSLHVALSLVVLAALWERAQPWRNLCLALWVLAITLSILPLHRHQFVDLVAGAVLALLAGVLAQHLARPRAATRF